MKPEKDQKEVELIARTVIDSRGGVNWKVRQQLQSYLEAGMVSDLSFALSNRYEIFLWYSCFKDILDLNSKEDNAEVVSGLNNDESDFTAEISTARFPSYIIGSLNSLMVRLIYKYNLNMNGRRLFGMEHVGMSTFNVEPAEGICRSDYLYAIQFCLVHIGDVLRQQRFMKEAVSYYEKAIDVSTHYGHPYNQLGLVETINGNKLTAAYFYMRALHGTVCFANARLNVERLYLTVDLSDPKFEVFPLNLLQMQAALYLDKQVDVAEKLYEKVACTVVEHVLNSTMSRNELLQVFVTSLGCLRRVMTTGETRTVARWQSRRLHVLVGFLQGLLTGLLESGEKLLLTRVPDVLYIFCRWVQYDWPKLLHMNDFIREVRFLKPLVKLLKSEEGGLNVSKEQFNSWKDIPLPIDRSLEGFQPLSCSHGTLDLSFERFRGAAQGPAQRTMLVLRLMQFGSFVSECLCDSNLLAVKIDEKEKLEYSFESCLLEATQTGNQEIDSVGQQEQSPEQKVETKALPSVESPHREVEKASGDDIVEEPMFTEKNKFVKAGKLHNGSVK